LRSIFQIFLRGLSFSGGKIKLYRAMCKFNTNKSLLWIDPGIKEKINAAANLGKALAV
jgi:hypothetical protein